MKPPFPYYGGKTRVAEEIASILPAHRHYVEPFFGAGSVLLAKPPIVMETVNDINGDLVHFFRTLRDRPADLERACFLTPHARGEFLDAHVHRGEDADDIERARRTFVILSQGRNASLRKTGWAHFQNPGNMSNAGSRPSYIQRMVGRFAGIADRMLNVSIENRDALQVIAEYGSHRDVLLYVDPPYLVSTRTSRGYEVEFDRPEQHGALLQALLDCEASVVLSGYDSDLYADMLATWQTHTLTGARDGRGQARREVIWSNRPLGGPETLFDQLVHSSAVQDHENGVAS